MPLGIQTFRHDGSRHFGTTPFKALGHPLAAAKGRALAKRLRRRGPVAVFDPDGLLTSFATFYGMTGADFMGVYVQRIEDAGRPALGLVTQSVHELAKAKVRTVFVAGFDAGRVIEHLRTIAPQATFLSFDELRLPDSWLANPRRYLDPLNFATNFAFLRDGDGRHTAIRTANYWGGYGARDAELWLCLFDAGGKVLAEWAQMLPVAGGTVVIDSRTVRERFGLGPFAGSLFIHALRIKGHDVVKYALDTFGDDDETISATHDANAWPADLYAGVPAPAADERVVLWVQNSHPIPIPAGEIAFGAMGGTKTATYPHAVPPFGTVAIDVGKLLPQLRWPDQVEVHAGRHFVRPRYEVERGTRSRIAHANVERTDLKADPAIASFGPELGRGFLLPFPLPPTGRFRAVLLPTPMATSQTNLPIAAVVFDSCGKEIVRHRVGKLPRRHRVALDIDELLGKARLKVGHVELMYDFAEGGEADGWLHALARYEDRRTGHIAETSFGAHIFNTLAVFKDEPQSYSGPPPGLSTRLFLRVGPAPAETFCHLVYAASAPWRRKSETDLVLTSAEGKAVATETVRIACGGSLFWRVSEMFDVKIRKRAGLNSYVLVRDTTCRLFGFHGLDTSAAFSLDHMFGF